MGEKRDPYKFTVQFSAADPYHLQAAEILNAQGRRKAAFLTSAILHYISCKETPDIMQAAPIDVKLIETVVNRLLNARQTPAKTESSSTHTNVSKPIRKSDEIHFDDAMDILGEDGMDAIAGAIAAFRK